jgi:hypothetical protein
MDAETFTSFCIACVIAAWMADVAMGRVRAHARRLRKEARS